MYADDLSTGFCKQQLWPLFHYVLPMSPYSAGRFDSELWQAYVKANKASEFSPVYRQRTFIWGHVFTFLRVHSVGLASLAEHVAVTASQSQWPC